MFLTLLIVFFSLIGLIILHELGHFVAAKRFKVKIEEFGIGLPPRIIGKKFGETLYSLNLLPFGAFVKVHGETKGIEDPRSFSEKPIWQRMLIVLGGVVGFWIISIILLSIVFGIGTSQVISDEEIPIRTPKVQIVAVAPSSPAEEAGIKRGDTIVSLKLKIKNEKLKIAKVKEVQEFVEAYKGQEIILTIQRGKEVFDVTLIPRVLPPEGEGAMGVALVRTAIVSYPWWESPIKGIEATCNLTLAVVKGLWQILENLIQGKGLPAGAQLIGPIGIAGLMVQIAQLGISYYLQFIALLSIYLAIFNILPIPALDGGKLLFLGIEKIRGKPLSSKIEQNITTIFFALLITLMILVTIRDIVRLF